MPGQITKPGVKSHLWESLIFISCSLDLYPQRFRENKKRTEVTSVLFVAPSGIEPEPEVPETSILSVELRGQYLIMTRKGRQMMN